jgi:excisionase family DNA binding protein
MQVAAEYGGYSLQYLRRLLRHGKLGDIKIAQLWLINKSALDACLKRFQTAADQRFGPK